MKIVIIIKEKAHMEHIISFLPGRLPNEGRFCCEMTGITYPDRN